MKIVVVNRSDRVNAEWLDAHSSVEGIIVNARGLDSVDLEECKARGVRVRGIDYGPWAVSELVLSLLLFLSRLKPALDGVEGSELRGKQVLVAGYGGIGSAIGNALSCLGAVVDPWDIALGGDAVSLEAKLKRADAVVIALPLNKGTRGLFNAKRLALLKQGALFVNVGRGAIVDIIALAKRKDLRVGLDVVRVESKEDEAALGELKANNAVVTEHLGWFTRESEERRVKALEEARSALLERE